MNSKVEPGRGGRVTLQEIARRLGVSTATVSLALRDSPDVAEATRATVQATAREMGYFYNRSAASLRTSRTSIIGVGFHDIAHPYFSALLLAIEQTAAAENRSILLFTYGEDLARQDRAFATMREYRPDGLIICTAAGTRPEALEPLISAGIPIVQVAREVEGANLDFVTSDDRHGTELAVRHLHALGHRRIAMFGGTDAISPGRARRASYRQTLAALGLTVDAGLMYEGLGTRDVGFRSVEAMMDRPNPPTAAICYNDLIAFGATLALRHRGLEAGRDFALVGSDDVSEAALWFPALTTIDNRHGEMGAAAARLLLERIDNPAMAPRRVLVEPAFVVRRSTMPLTR